MEEKRKILIVEDSEDVQNAYEQLLGAKYNLLQAYSLAAAEKAFNANPDIAVVIMDGNVDDQKDRTCDTLTLSAKMRKQRPKLPIIATSVFYAEEQMKHGCDKLFTKDLGAPVIAMFASKMAERKAA